MQQRLVKLRNKVLIQPEIKDANFGYLVAIYGQERKGKWVEPRLYKESIQLYGNI